MNPKLAAILFAICHISFCRISVGAKEVTPEKQHKSRALEQITANIIDKELELMQMSTTLKLQTAPQSQWKERRWFAYSVTNQTLTVAGALMNGLGRLYYRHMNSKAPKNLFVNASWLRIVANAVAIAECATETFMDGSKQWAERRTIVIWHHLSCESKKFSRN